MLRIIFNHHLPPTRQKDRRTDRQTTITRANCSLFSTSTSSVPEESQIKTPEKKKSRDIYSRDGNFNPSSPPVSPSETVCQTGLEEKRKGKGRLDY